MKRIGVVIVPAILIGFLFGAFPEPSLPFILGCGEAVGMFCCGSRANCSYGCACCDAPYVCYHAYPCQVIRRKATGSVKTKKQRIAPSRSHPKDQMQNIVPEERGQYINPLPGGSGRGRRRYIIERQETGQFINPAPPQGMQQQQGVYPRVNPPNTVQQETGQHINRGSGGSGSGGHLQYFISPEEEGQYINPVKRQ